MNQPATPNSLIEGFPALPTPSAYGHKGLDGHDPDNGHKLLIGLSVQPGGTYFKANEVKLFTEDQVQAHAAACVLADRAQRPSSLAPTVAGSVDTPELLRLPESKICEIAEKHLQGDSCIADAAGWYQFDRAGLDAFAIEIMDTYTHPAPSSPTALGQQAQAVPDDSKMLDWLDQNIFHRSMDEWDAHQRPSQIMWVTFGPKNTQGSARRIIAAAMAYEDTAQASANTPEGK